MGGPLGVDEGCNVLCGLLNCQIGLMANRHHQHGPGRKVSYLLEVVRSPLLSTDYLRKADCRVGQGQTRHRHSAPRRCADPTVSS